MIICALKKNGFFYSYLNICINFKHSKNENVQPWTKVSMSFNVLSQPTWHFDAYNNKCSLVAKEVTGISLSSICLQPHLEVSRKRNETSYLFPSFLSAFVEAWIWLEKSEMNLHRILTYFLQKSSSDSNLLVRKASWFPFLEAHALTIKCPCPCFKENKKRSKVRKKMTGVFYSECRAGH